MLASCAIRVVANLALIKEIKNAEDALQKTINKTKPTNQYAILVTIHTTTPTRAVSANPVLNLAFNVSMSTHA